MIGNVFIHITQRRFHVTIVAEGKKRSFTYSERVCSLVSRHAKRKAPYYINCSMTGSTILVPISHNKRDDFRKKVIEYNMPSFFSVQLSPEIFLI
jgi:hypothetical protein